MERSVFKHSTAIPTNLKLPHIAVPRNGVRVPAAPGVGQRVKMSENGGVSAAGRNWISYYLMAVIALQATLENLQESSKVAPVALKRREINDRLGILLSEPSSNRATTA